MDITDRAQQTRENRAFTVEDIEIRAEGDGLTFDGIASSVDTAYTVRDVFGEFSETITKGSFNRTLKQRDDVRLLVNHAGVPLARTKSGTIQLSADPHLRAQAPGLDPANPTVQEIQSALSRRDIDQMSIGMRVKDDVWNSDYTERTIREVELLDVSIVTFPANPATAASIRSLDEAIRALTTSEDWDEPTLRRAIAHLETLLPRDVPTDRSELNDAIRFFNQRRFADIYSNDVSGMLQDSLVDRFKPATDCYVWVRDFSDTEVIFEMCGTADPGTFSLAYSLVDGNLTLDSGDPVEVNVKTTYVPDNDADDQAA